MRRALFILMVSILLPGCLWRVGVNGKHFTQPGGATTVDTTKLRLDGYYWRYEYYSDSRRLVIPMILWKCGTAALSHGGYSTPSRDENSDYLLHEETQGRILRALSKKTGERRSPITLQWGGFRVWGDSISIQILELNGPVRSWDPFEYAGPIVNDTTFVIDRVTRPRQPFAFSRKQEAIDPPWVFHFQPLAPGEKPTSDNWTQTHDALQ